MIYEIKRDEQTLKFNGDKIAHSTSRKAGNPRWVEFDLYKTVAGQYVISRIGYSLTYHNQHCKTVRRNYLQPVAEEEIPRGYVPCDICKPQRLNPEERMFPERERPWGQGCPTAQGVIESLMKFDENDIAYLTNVARDLLREAAKVDTVIRDAYYTQIIE